MGEGFILSSFADPSYATGTKTQLGSLLCTSTSDEGERSKVHFLQRVGHIAFSTSL